MTDDLQGKSTRCGAAYCRTHALPGDPTCARSARSIVRDAVMECEWHGDVDAAVLLTSEIVSNALQHAGGASEITVNIEGPLLRIETRDPSDESPSPRSAGPEDDAGRGLAMVGLLSSAWGSSQSGDDGKTVWFELRDAPRASEVLAVH